MPSGPGKNWLAAAALLIVLGLVDGCGSGTGLNEDDDLNNDAGDGDATGSGNDNTADDPPPITFERVQSAGLSRRSAADLTSLTTVERLAGGVAAGDYDGDGDVDLYAVGGARDPNHLYRNTGEGNFVEVANAVGLDITHLGSGPAFGDIDGDGDLDLFVGAVAGDSYRLFENRLTQDGAFLDVTDASGIVLTAPNTVAAVFYDYDSDGYLDLFLTHFGTPHRSGDDTETVWRNNGDRTFSSTSIDTTIALGLVDLDTDRSLTPNFADIDGDGDGDLLMTSDLGESRVFLNNGDGTFTEATDRSAISEETGHGATTGDFDNDGDTDWIVSAVYDLDTATGTRSGNRFYRNDGVGGFVDRTQSHNADGGWGFGTCAADFDNDGYLDVAQTNGWLEDGGKDFAADATRLFANRGTGAFTFDEIAESAGLDHTAQGRGIACFDADADGDVDVVITNSGAEALTYYRNTTDNANHYLVIRLEGSGTNSHAVGAIVTVTTATGSQQRQVGGRNNFASHDPLVVHFGLGGETTADVAVLWPDGTTSTLTVADVDRALAIAQD